MARKSVSGFALKRCSILMKLGHLVRFQVIPLESGMLECMARKSVSGFARKRCSTSLNLEHLVGFQVISLESRMLYRGATGHFAPCGPLSIFREILMIELL